MAVMIAPAQDCAAPVSSTGSREAWRTFTLVFLLMMVDYIDRQVIVSLFPALKAEFGWSDTQLGALVSVVPLMVAIASMPVAMVLDRWSRTRGILVMGALWSLATTACGWATNHAQLFAGRLCTGLGEAGYGPAGSALLASRFPARMHGFILAAFQAAGGIGSILGVLLGAYITAHWGWRSAFGVVGVPGLMLALLFWFVPDYQTRQLSATGTSPHAGRQDAIGAVVRATVRELRSSPTALWVSVGSAMQLALTATMLSWLPSFFGRVHQLPTERAGAMTAVVVIAFSIGAVVWGRLIDRIGSRDPRHRIRAMAWLCVLTAAAAVGAFGLVPVGSGQVAAIVLVGALMSCTVGTVLAIMMDVIRPEFRATAAAFVALVGNVGMAAGPFLVGAMSDAWGLQTALTVAGAFPLIAAALFVRALPGYRSQSGAGSA